MCHSDVKPKAIKSKKVSPHFAHVDVSKCNKESMIHWWFKNAFIQIGDEIRIKSDQLQSYTCKSIDIEQTIIIDGINYRPDVTVTTDCGNIIYFEMNYSNKKSTREYLEIWIKLNRIVVEIDIKNMLQKEKVFKALFYSGKCFNIKNKDAYYHNIGKHKEYILSHSYENNAIEIKERTKKLDWFWDDVKRYSENKVSISDISILIDSIDYRDKEIVNKILKKNMCSELYNDYLEYKQLDQKAQFKEEASENEKIMFIQEEIKKLKITPIPLDIELKCKRNYVGYSYYNGSRRHPIKYGTSFSHYTYDVLILNEKKIINKISITNKIMKMSFGEIKSLIFKTKELISNKRKFNECKACKRRFYLTYSEINYFTKKSLHVPKRCKVCRKENKQKG